MWTKQVFLDIYDSAGTTLQARSTRLQQATVTWPLNAVGGFDVEMLAADPAVTALAIGRVVKLVGSEGVLSQGTIRDIGPLRALDDRPAYSLQFLNRFDDLNAMEVMRRWWDNSGAGAAMSAILATTGSNPPGLLSGTGWTLSIEAAVGLRERCLEFLWGSLLRAILQAIEGAQAAWWADPITKVLYVGEFGSDSGVVIAVPSGQDPGDSDAPDTADTTTLWATRITKSVQGPKANRIFGVGAENDDADEGRIHLPYPGPLWGTYTVKQMAGNMTGQYEYYIEDATSQASYGVIEYGLINRGIDMERVSEAAAQNFVYTLCQSAMLKWKDPVTRYDVECVNNRVASIGRATVTPGSKVRLVYRGRIEQTHPVTLESMGVEYEDVNALYYVTGLSRSWDENGAETVRMQLSSSLEIGPALRIPT